MPANNGIRYIWFDTEYTTLDLDQARLLQVAAVVTDTNLKRLHPREQDVNLYVRLEEGDAVDPWVLENLGDVVVRARGPEALPLEEVDTRLAAHLDAVLGEASPQIRLRPILAGNSIHADWVLVRRLMPRLLERIHYRLLDVTTVKLEWMRWFGGESFDKENPDVIRSWFQEAFIDETIGPHNAYYDVQASIAELAFYRHRLRKADPQNASTSGS